MGVVEEVDILDGDVGWGEYLRVRIFLDVSKPLARGRLLHLQGKSVWVAFKYEKIPKFCYNCGVIRHGKLGCSAQGRRRNPGSDSDQPYGPWLRVSFPNRRGGGEERFERAHVSQNVGRKWRKGNSGGFEHNSKAEDGGDAHCDDDDDSQNPNPSSPNVMETQLILERKSPLQKTQIAEGSRRRGAGDTPDVFALPEGDHHISPPQFLGGKGQLW